MKLDIEYFRKILEEIEGNEVSRCTLGELITALSINEADNSTLVKLRGHLDLLYGSGLLTSSGEDCGFLNTMDLASASPNNNNVFTMTLAGHKLLEEKRDENWLDDAQDILEILFKFLVFRSFL